jgi:hypothetical protein
MSESSPVAGAASRSVPHARFWKAVFLGKGVWNCAFTTFFFLRRELFA